MLECLRNVAAVAHHRSSQVVGPRYLRALFQALAELTSQGSERHQQRRAGRAQLREEIASFGGNAMLARERERESIFLEHFLGTWSPNL